MSNGGLSVENNDAHRGAYIWYHSTAVLLEQSVFLESKQSVKNVAAGRGKASRCCMSDI